MASAYRQSVPYCNAQADAAADWHDGGTPPGRIEWRVGSPPTNITDASTGALLGTNLFANPAFGNASNRVVTANAIVSDSSADDSGTVGYGRAYQGGAADTAAGYEFSAGATGDTPDVVFDNPVFVEGGVIAISSWTITSPLS